MLELLALDWDDELSRYIGFDIGRTHVLGRDPR